MGKRLLLLGNLEEKSNITAFHGLYSQMRMGLQDEHASRNKHSPQTRYAWCLLSNSDTFLFFLMFKGFLMIARNPP